MDEGSIEIQDSISNSKIAIATFKGYHISLEKRQDSLTFSGDLESMELKDYYTKNSKFPKLIAPSTIINEEDDDDPYFFSMLVDVNPLDSIADYRLMLSMKPLNIILSKSFINKITKFFSDPIKRIRQQKMEKFNVKAYTRLQEIRQQTEDQLVQAMADRKIFDVQVHLSAPNIMIPKNFEDEYTETLLLVLGTLSISSDLRGKKKRKSDNNNETDENDEFSDIEDNNIDMEGFEDLVSMAQKSISESASGKNFSYLYDKFYLSLTSLEAGITSNNEKSKKFKPHPDENLIEKFDVNLYLEVCNIDSFELPKIIVSGTLPSLSLNISPEKTSAIMKILNTLSKTSKADLDELQTISIEEIEDISSDEESDSSNDKNSEKNDNNQNEIPLSQIAQKKQVQLNFSIPEAKILFSEKQHQITFICLKGISATYLKQPFDTHVTLALHAVVIEDRLQPWGSEFKYLATSETLSLNQSSKKYNDLISVSYRGINPEAPHYDNINHSVNFGFNKVHVTLNRETILTLVGCLKNIQKALKKPDSEIQPPINNNNDEKKDNNEENNNDDDNDDDEEDNNDEESIAIQKRTLFSVSASVSDISMTMNDTGVKIGIIQLKNSTFGFKLFKNTMRVEGTLGTMKITDLDPGSEKYPEMFDVEDQEDMVTFSYETFKENQPDFPGYGVLLKIVINSVRYMWIERFQLRVRRFFSEISEMQKLLSSTASSVEAAIKQRRLFCYQIDLNNPYIVVPQNVNSDKCLIIDLGKIAIEKQFPNTELNHQMTRIFVDVKAMNWKTGLFKSNNYREIIDNTDLQLWWEKPSDEPIHAQHIYPSMNVWVYFPRLRLILTEHQSWQICDSVAENICAEPTEHEKMVEEKKLSLRNQVINHGPLNTISSINLADTISILNNERISDDDDFHSFKIEEEDEEEKVKEFIDELNDLETEKWIEMFIDFHIDLWEIEALKDSGVDENNNHTMVGNLEVRHWDMKYTSYSNGAHLGLFIMESMKIFDRRYNNPNQFKEILTPLVPGVGKLGIIEDNNKPPPNIVGSWTDKKNQFQCRYERFSSGYQDISFSWDHCYFILVPDAIFEIFDIVKPVIFDDIMPATEKWRNWKNPNQINVIPESHQNQEMQIKIAITSSEIFLLEDSSNINTPSLVIRSTFSIIFKRNIKTNTRIWVVIVDDMEGFKCRLATEDSAFSIMQPINWSVDYYANDDKSNIVIDFEPMVFYFSYKDYKTSKKILDNWLPWLNGRIPRERKKPKDDTNLKLIDEIEYNDEENDKIFEKLLNTKIESSEDDNENEDDDDDEDDENDSDDNYFSQLDPVIRSQLSSDTGSITDSLLSGDEASSEEEDTNKIILMDLVDKDIENDDGLELFSPIIEEISIQDKDEVDQYMQITTGGLKFILIDDSLENQNCPLANILMEDFKVELNSWSTNMKLRLSTKMKIDYYNMQLEVWEPVLEPWIFQFILSRSPQPKQFTKYQLYANRKCEVNITAAMIETTLNTIEAITNDNDGTSGELPALLNPYIIKNETGLLISYWLPNEEEYLLFNLNPGEERSLQDISSGRVQRKIRKKSDEEKMLPPCVSLIVEGEYTPVKDIPIEKVGTYITRISPVNRNAFLACDVSFRTGSKVLTVKSNIIISNHTLHKLYAFVVVEFQDSAMLEPIEPGHSYPVPLAFAPTGTIQFRPNEEYRWNDGELLLFKIHRLKRLRYVSCKPLQKNIINLNGSINSSSDSSQQSLPSSSTIIENNFYYRISLTTSHSGKIHHINVYPPLCLVNLLPIVMEFRIIHKHTKQTLLNQSIKKGETQYIHSVDPQVPLILSIKIPCFGWSKPEDINSNVPSEVIRLLDEQRRTLSLRILNVIDSITGMRKVSIFAQYWMVNHTGLRLLYRRSGIDSSLAAGQGQNEKKKVILGSRARDWYDINNELETPFLFTTPFFNIDPRGDLARVKIANSEWSQNINLNSQGTTSVFEIPDRRKPGKITQSFCLSMMVSSGSDIFWRTKIVSFYPRFIIVNNLKQDFIYHQRNTISQITCIHPGENIPFHWTDEKAPRQICIRLNDKGWEWSGGFSINELASFSLRIRNSIDSKLSYLVRVRIRIDNASTLIIVSPENIEFPGYRVENNTRKFMKISQVSSKNYDILEPKEKLAYAWDKPMAPHTLVLSFQGHDERLEVNMDQLKSYPPIRVGRDKMKVIVSANGPTKVLSVKLLNDRKSKDWIELGKEDNNDNDNLLNINDEEIPQMEFQLTIQGIGMSVIDETPQELSYITIEKILLIYNNSNLYKNFEFSVGWLQIDNQLYQTPYPVVVYPISNANDIDNDKNVFFNLTTRILNQVNTITYIKSFCVVLQKLDLKLDEEFVLRLMKYVSYITKFYKKRQVEQQHLREKEEKKEEEEENEENEEKKIDEQDPLEEEDPSLESALRNQNEYEEMVEHDIHGNTNTNNSIFLNYKPEKTADLDSRFIYFEILHIAPIQVNFSFANVPGAIRDQDTMVSRILSRGGILANIDSAPLVLGQLVLEHPFSTRNEILDRISKHYINSAIREFHKMLGSADFLGSPISFVRTMSTGFYDFINEPTQNLDSPYAFSMGIARGTQSLIKNSTWGAFNSATKISNTIGKGAAALTFDKPYIREREILSRDKPLHVAQGIAFGLRDFGLGCFQGIGGIVYEPLRGAYDERLPGMVKGIGRGAIGFGLKPMIGVVDFVTRTTEGIRNTATYWDEIRRGRVRPPRYFGRDKVLETYSMVKSRGQELLFTIDHGKYRKYFYVHHIEEETTIVLLSNAHIISMSRYDSEQEDWNVKVSDICGIETDKRGVLLHLNDYIASSAFESPTHKRVIFCRAQKRQQMYNTLLYWLQILKHPGAIPE